MRRTLRAALLATPLALLINAAQAQQSRIGTSGAWQVENWGDLCVALLFNPRLRPDRGNLLRLDHDGRAWTIVTDFRIRRPVEANITVDGRPFRTRMEQVENAAFGPISPALLEALREGSQINLNLQSNGPQYTLNGVASAIDLLRRCAGGLAAQPGSGGSR